MTDTEKVIEIAKSQIGVAESPKNSNKQQYGEWYGWNGVAWCMIFVQWVFAHAGQTLPYKTASCSSLLNWYKRNRPDQVHDTPEIGDIVIFDWGHTGIVMGLSKSYIITIEGNTSPTIIGSQDNGGGVYQRYRAKSKVTAYIRPYEAEKQEEDGKVTVTLDVLRKGSKGQQVRQVQRLLVAMGYAAGKADGDFGSLTEEALKEYQREHNLTVDGICGKKTWDALLGAD